MTLTPYFKNLLISLPLTLLTITPFIFLGEVLDLSFRLHLIGLGALGWWLALLLRLPVMLAAKKLSDTKGRTAVILSSGPTEEIVRLTLLLIVGLTVENGYLIGLGWAAIEVVYSIVQGFGMGVLDQKTDAKAEEAKALMKTIGMDKAMNPTAPYWGIMERLSANALHIAFSLLLIVSPYLIFLTAPIHSLINLTLTKLVKRSIAAAEVAIATASIVIFSVALLLVM